MALKLWHWNMSDIDIIQFVRASFEKTLVYICQGDDNGKISLVRLK